MSSFNEIMAYYPGNRVAYNRLLKRIKEQSIIPFIGAGLSACYYPSWEELLSGLLLVVPDSCARKAKNQINSHDYFSAEALNVCIDSYTSDGFHMEHIALKMQRSNISIYV